MRDDVRDDKARQPTHLASQVNARRHRVTAPPGVVTRQQRSTPQEPQLDEVFFCTRDFATQNDAGGPTETTAGPLTRARLHRMVYQVASPAGTSTCRALRPRRSIRSS